MGRNNKRWYSSFKEKKVDLGIETELELNDSVLCWWTRYCIFSGIDHIVYIFLVLHWWSNEFEISRLIGSVNLILDAFGGSGTIILKMIVSKCNESWCAYILLSIWPGEMRCIGLWFVIPSGSILNSLSIQYRDSRQPKDSPQLQTGRVDTTAKNSCSMCLLKDWPAGLQSPIRIPFKDGDKCGRWAEGALRGTGITTI